MTLLGGLIADKVEFFSRILDTTHDVIWAMDLDGNFNFYLDVKLVNA